MKKILFVLPVLLTSFLFVGCNGINVTSNEEATFETTTVGNISQEEITTNSDYLKLSHIYNLAVEADEFDGTYEEWLESVRGPQGEPGKQVLLQVNNGYIQWQYVGETTWENLIEISSLIGPKGSSGADGQTPYIGENGNWWIGEVDTQINIGSSQENMDRIGTDGLYFSLTIRNGIAGYEVTGYSGSETDIIIPNKVFGEKVISIRQDSLPDTITSLSISQYTEKLPSFEDYSYLLNVDFNHAPVEYIPYEGFKDAVNLRTITNYENIKRINDYAFYNTQILFTGFDYSNIQKIGSYAFYQSVSNLEFEEGLMFNETNDMVQISDITYLYIPENVTEIGERAFPSEFSIYYAGDSDVKFESENPYFFKNVKKTDDGYWYIDKNTYISVLNYSGELEQITIPTQINGRVVSSIEKLAFIGDNHLSRINIPSSVTSIGSDAFKYTRKLYVIHIPSSIINITNSFFGQWNYELNYYGFPASVKVFENNQVDMNINPDGIDDYEWGRYAFGYSSDEIKMDDNFVYIEKLTTVEIIAFKDATGKVTVPATFNNKPITRIHPNSFIHYNGGIKFVDISEGVQYISSSAFVSYYLKYINIPSSVSAVNYNAFYTEAAIIYVKDSSKPENWDSSWYYDVEDIIWGEKLDAMISDDLYMYEIINGKAWIKEYLGSWSYNTALVLPDKIEGYTVVGIRKDAIKYSSNSSSYHHKIVIPNTITQIEEKAIYYYKYLDIYAEFNSKPTNWHDYFGYSNYYGSSDSYRTYYWNGEWEYIDGVPTPTI